MPNLCLAAEGTYDRLVRLTEMSQLLGQHSLVLPEGAAEYLPRFRTDLPLDCDRNLAVLRSIGHSRRGDVHIALDEAIEACFGCVEWWVGYYLSLSAGSVIDGDLSQFDLKRGERIDSTINHSRLRRMDVKDLRLLLGFLQGATGLDLMDVVRRATADLANAA